MTENEVTRKREPTYRFEVFEGPLDLLLSLIEKHKIDIYDIQISLLLEQYLLYMQQAEEHDWALTADFVEMAARLTYIKSYSLLPPTETDEDTEDPKLSLEQMLRQYAMYKKLAGELRSDYIGDRIFFREVVPQGLPKPPANYSYTAERIEKAFRRLMLRYASRNLNSKTFSSLIGTEFISVNSKIVYVLRSMRRHKNKVVFDELFTACKSRSEIVATFLAVLELIRCGRLDMENAENDDVILTISERKVTSDGKTEGDG